MSLDIKNLYRRGLRVAKLLEGQRRRRLCAHRTKQMLYSAIKNIHDTAKVQDELLSVDLYLDQVELQGQHLRRLAERPESLIIPIDLYESSKVAKPLLDCLPGRRLTEAERKGNVQDVLGGRLFQGPEPSWIRKKRQSTLDAKTPARHNCSDHPAADASKIRPALRGNATDVQNE